ncbi:MAG: hypothetical protein KME42_03710 [Tildeniella nuda ZEHNDER 1965/U140]|jgi:hypothetical protein|nr:hypothetical protein [Tildeniella nuda ZEHNDER 1965/U140]
MAMSTNGSVATNKPKLNAYVGEEINQAIEKEMAAERRSKSQMVELLLEEALKARGYTFTGQDTTGQQDRTQDH